MANLDIIRVTCNAAELSVVGTLPITSQRPLSPIHLIEGVYHWERTFLKEPIAKKVKGKEGKESVFEIDITYVCALWDGFKGMLGVAVGVLRIKGALVLCCYDSTPPTSETRSSLINVFVKGARGVCSEWDRVMARIRVRPRMLPERFDSYKTINGIERPCVQLRKRSQLSSTSSRVTLQGKTLTGTWQWLTHRISQFRGNATNFPPTETSMHVFSTGSGVPMQVIGGGAMACWWWFHRSKWWPIQEYNPRLLHIFSAIVPRAQTVSNLHKKSKAAPQNYSGKIMY
ncbi:hypothetical protein K439DRAFT_1505686 [Ramaria rubella]|nr:hypothetical protein K439DRAFT_1505686 [Ramaria rubella]